ncbi:MAG: RecQ family ATP-dependent DNA helicase [Sphaerochaetaceae bacterium]|nr:RecQ family ATP-dependent DNA helicase [Sphaerochaetaceae bacterium]
MVTTLRNRFSLTSLYPFQELVVRTILEKEEAQEGNNLLVILPTGAGKSICFMLPSLIIDGITMIVYPLLSLLNDQKRRIEALGEEAVVLRGGQSSEEREALFSSLSSGSASFLLLTCEMLEIESVRRRITHLPISLAVVDEAHVIAQWGLTFRPAYLHLGSHIAQIEPHQVLAFTATLDRKNASVIHRYLFQNERYHTIRGSSDRENIHYRVMRTLSKDLSLRLLLAIPSSRPAIIFFRSRRKTESTSQRLRECMESVAINSYHAGMAKDERDTVEQWFRDSDSGILCATSAFGMGVDKKNVRSVIHYDLPDDAMAFLQESGRGGRDGSKAYSVILLSPSDLKQKQNALLPSLTSTITCRRERLLALINSPTLECTGCDVCEANSDRTYLGIYPILSIVSRYGKRFDTATLKAYLKGEKGTVHPFGRYNGVFSSWESREIGQAIGHLLNTGRIRETKGRKLLYAPLSRVAEHVGNEYVHLMISEQDTIAEILTRYPFIKDALVEHNSVFRNLNNPVMLKTVAKFAKLKDAAKNSGEDIASLMAFINREIEKHQAES